MDYVSLVNLWCQKHGKPLPIYEYENSYNLMWTCFSTWSPTSTIPATTNLRIQSTQPNKKNAKQEVAAMLYSKYCCSQESKIKVDRPTILLVDGDQRSDVLKWLSKSELPDNLKIHVYISPCMNLQVDSSKFVMHVAKSTSRDSADAMILIDLGRLMHIGQEEIVIVSSDHILVQAAQDYGLKWAKNLPDLQALLSST